MRNIIFVVILILAILPLYAESNTVHWEHLASRGVYLYYYDSDNIQHLSGNSIQVKLKRTYADKDSVNQFFLKYSAKDRGIELEDHSISTMVINCSEKIVGVKSRISHKKSSEINLHSNYKDIYYLYIPSGSIYKALYDKVC